MTENEIINHLMDRFIQRLRPVLYEAVNECLEQAKPTAPVPESDDLWTIKDVMSHFGCAKTTVFAWRKRGLLKAHRMGNKTFFKKKDIEKLLK